MSLLSKHFSRDELLSLASCSEEISAIQRPRLLLHLGGDCGVCRSRLLPAKGEETGACSPPDAGVHDPLLRALRRRLPGPSQIPEADRLWPRHHYLATQPRAPLAFLRLLIEEAADLEAPSHLQKIDASLERVFYDLALFAEALEAEPELPISPRGTDQPRWDQLLADLEGLTFTYLARERWYESSGQDGQTESAEAWVALAQGTASPMVKQLRESAQEPNMRPPEGAGPAEVGKESLAILLDLEGRWALAAEDFETANDRFSLVATLASREIPGRAFESKLGLIRTALRQGLFPLAEALLKNLGLQARSFDNPRLLLESRFLESLVLLQTGQHEKAETQLMSQETLCEQVGAPTVRVRWLIAKAWLELQLQEPQPEDAGYLLNILLEDWRSSALAELASRLGNLAALKEVGTSPDLGSRS